MISLDTETTGIDLYHGAKPFLVTICYEGGDISYWEWEVDPYTREPQIPKEDKEEIMKILLYEEVILQNAKFDVRALETIGIKGWGWERTHDTLFASHLLNSSKPKDLATAALLYLGIDLQPIESRLEEITNKARRIARSQFPDWRIAKEGLQEMPSAKQKVWKYDLWLPKAIAKAQGLPEEHSWYTQTPKYANADSEVTLLLFKEQKKLLKERGLWDLYQQRRKLFLIVYEMERVGVTLNSQRLDELTDTYELESKRAATTCKRIARKRGYNLKLPKSGNSKSLLEFTFNVLKIPVVAKTPKGNPSLDNKRAVPEYLDTLEGDQLNFIKALAHKRKRDTSMNYMEGYRRFMLPLEELQCNAAGLGELDTIPNWFVLHPSLNPTGTQTLRWSSYNPNSQNISKQKDDEGLTLRYAFGPAPGREWWSLDYNNLELRIPAYECQEPAMLELFEQPDNPPYYGSYHLLIFDILYPDIFRKHGVKVKEPHLYKDTLYQWVKNGNFAELYGAIDTGDGKSTADRAFHYPGAQAIVAKRLKKKAALNKHWINFAKKYGYVETLPDKTVDPTHGYPLHCPTAKWGGISSTIPLNYHVQGTACWVIQQAMIKVYKYLQQINKAGSYSFSQGYQMVMQVHDELVFDFPYKPNKGNLPKIKRIKKLMESCGDDIGIPLTVGVDYHPTSWDRGE